MRQFPAWVLGVVALLFLVKIVQIPFRPANLGMPRRPAEVDPAEEAREARAVFVLDLAELPGDAILACHGDGALILYEASGRRRIPVPASAPGDVEGRGRPLRMSRVAAALGSEESSCVIATGDGHLLLWPKCDLNADPIVLTTGGIMPHAMAISPDGAWGALGCSANNSFGESKLQLWSLRERRLIWQQEFETSIPSLCFSHDSTRLAAVIGRQTWLLRMGDATRPVELSELPVRATRAAFTADSRGLLAALEGQRVSLWSFDDHRIVRSIEVLESALMPSLCPHPGGRKAFAGDVSGRLLCLDFDAGTVESDLPAHTASISRLLIAADGRTLITASYDGSIRRWDIDSLIEKLPQ